MKKLICYNEPMASDQLFYIGQKAFIEKNGKVLVIMSPDIKLDFPGGKIQEGEEDFVEALKREVREETNVEIQVEKPFTIWHVPETRIRKLDPKKPICLIGYKCTYVSGNIELSDEHDSYIWVTKDTYQTVFSDNDEKEFQIALQTYFEEK